MESSRSGAKLVQVTDPESPGPVVWVLGIFGSGKDEFRVQGLGLRIWSLGLSVHFSGLGLRTPNTPQIYGVTLQKPGQAPYAPIDK